MATCALFIDYENVFKSLRGRNINPSHKQMAEIFKSETLAYGEVVYARAYAPWDIFPEAMSVFDRHDIKPEYVEGGRKDNADLVMSLQIQEYMRVPGRDADTFILVTGDGDFVHVIRLLQQEKKRVVVWGVEGSISSRLATRVAEIVNIQQMLTDHGVVPLLNGDQPMGRLLRPEGLPSRDIGVRALIIRAETVMLARGWVQVPFLTLMHEMSTSTAFGEDSEARRMLIVKCLEAGILETKKQPNPKRPGTDTTFILLKKEHATVAQCLQTTNVVVHHCRQLLGSMPGASWVAYGLLDKALANEVSMPPGTGEAERRSWIDLCISEGLMRLEKKENPRNPEYPTSALYLCDDHPFVQQVVPGLDLSPMLRRLVVSLDHYLTRTGYVWMSMGLLRHQLVVYGQQEMERAIRIANESGVLVIRQQPNQFGSRPTTGAYLQYDQPLAKETLSQRDIALDCLTEVFNGHESLPRAEVLAALESYAGLGGDQEARREWLHCFVSHQICSAASIDGEENVTLNAQHPVVAKRSLRVG